MKGKILIILSTIIAITSCQKMSEEEMAKLRVEKAQTLVENNQLNSAKIELDSVHLLYPRQVAIRRIAKALEDSIVYLEAQRSLHYSDSLLQTVEPRVDSLKRQFKYSKDEKYQTQGEFVHKLLQTTSNTSRNFLQAYIQEDGNAIVKCYYFGAKSLKISAMQISADEYEQTFGGERHGFDDIDGVHEILTLSDNDAMSTMNFVSSNMTSRIRIELKGSSSAVFYLSDSEKHALEDTYRLGMLMKDVQILQKNIHISQMQIAKYENVEQIMDNLQ